MLKVTYKCYSVSHMCRKYSYETHVKNDCNYITLCASATGTVAALTAVAQNGVMVIKTLIIQYFM